MTKLEHIWHFGYQDPVMLFLALECLGQKHPIYKCSFCRATAEHYSGNVNERCYVVCKKCGEASILVKDGEAQ